MAEYRFLTTTGCWRRPRAGLGRDLRLRALAGRGGRASSEADKLEEGRRGGRRPVRPLRLEVEAAVPARVLRPDRQGRGSPTSSRATPRASSPASAAGGSSSSGGVTAVLYEWNVRTTRSWMNLFAPLAPADLRRQSRLRDAKRRRGPAPGCSGAPPAGDRLGRARPSSVCGYNHSGAGTLLSKVPNRHRLETPTPARRKCR